jgi:SAM-dependent methyltransferase
MSASPPTSGPESRRQHWEAVYQTKSDEQLSWYQARPEVSLRLIEGLRPPPRRVIDVGGGQSALAGELVARGVPEVTVLDVSAGALERARARLGPAVAGRIRWVHGDVLEVGAGLGPVDLWHDRAVFHFLTDPGDRRRYAAAAAEAVVPGGHAIVATFALTGPERCSGLPVCRYDAEGLGAEFAPAFRLAGSAAETHVTPWGKAQDFTYAVLERTGTGGAGGP